MNHKLLLATSNQGKINEIQILLAHLPLKIILTQDLLPPPDQLAVNETADTFTGNAIIKASTWGKYAGILTLAEDSGLIVDALNGRPGVHSQRYGSSDHNRIHKLLTELKHVPENQRTARFTSSIAIYLPQTNQTHTVTASVRGRITTKPTGTNGFGYDPIFYCFDLQKTFAQASMYEKNQISHRTQALKKAIPIIQKLFTPASCGKSLT